MKEKFAEVTQQQVAEFASYLQEFYRIFKLSGPATAGQNTGPDGKELTLDDGFDLLKKYDFELKNATKRREELVKAQTLFQLPIAAYPELAIVE